MAKVEQTHLRDCSIGQTVQITAVVVAQRKQAGRTVCHIPGVGVSSRWDCPASAEVVLIGAPLSTLQQAAIENMQRELDED